MTVFDFAASSPVLAFLLCWITLTYVVILINRILRHWNIRKHGYPPPHCDGDGDFKKEQP